MNKNKAVLLVVISAILFSLLGIFVKNLNLSPASIVSFRFSIGLILMTPLLTRIHKEEIYKFDKNVLIVSVIYGTWVFLFIHSLSLTKFIGNSVFLLYTSLIFSTIFSHFILKESVKKVETIYISSSLIGSILILKPFNFQFNYPEFLALLSGILYGLQTVLVRKLYKKHSTLYILFFQFLIPSLIFLPFFPFNFLSLDKGSLINLFLLSTISTTLPVILFTYSLKFLSAYKVMTIALIEPFSASLLSLIFLSQHLDLLSLIGGILIIASNILLISPKQKISLVN